MQSRFFKKIEFQTHMIIINKSILEIEKGLIVQAVNCFGLHGGLNGQICKKWSKVQKAYKEICEKAQHSSLKGTQLLGHVQFVKINENLIIANAFTQYDTGIESRKTEYSAIHQCFKNIKLKIFENRSKTNLYFPWRFGSFRGGGDWNLVFPIIEHYFSDGTICKFLP